MNLWDEGGCVLARSNDYKSLNALMRHIRQTAGIDIGGSADKKALAQVGYFHGYKGYRYTGKAGKRIPYAHFSELRAVIRFDSQLKSVLYPVLMNLEMTMKNLALVEILEAADSSRLADVYSRLMPGTKKGKRGRKLEVMHASNEVLLNSYKRNNVIVRHYYDSPDETVPVWALMEVITLGHFARFLEQLSDPVLASVANRWGLQKRDAELIPHLVYALTDLRNCVAHNGTVFDTRFRTAAIRQQVPNLLVREIGFPPSVRVQFETVTDYLALIVYMACCMSLPKREVRATIREYSELTDELRASVPTSIFDMIVRTDNRAKIQRLQQWVRGN
jgi:abortive infection bacteriophage resistance protein